MSYALLFLIVVEWDWLWYGIDLNPNIKRKFKLPQKIVQKSHIIRITQDKEYNYPGFPSDAGDVTFTHNFNTGYFNDLTFRKIKGVVVLEVTTYASNKQTNTGFQITK